LGRILVVREFGSFVGKKGARLVIRGKERRSEIPAEELECVILAGRGVSISTDALQLLIRRGIPVFFSDGMGNPLGAVMPAFSTGSASTRREQYLSLLDERGFELAKSFAMGKVLNQAYLMFRLARSRRRTNRELADKLERGASLIRELVERISGFSSRSLDFSSRAELMALESRAATIYWDVFSSLLPEEFNFPGRVTRGAEDEVNSMLNLGYWYLRTRILPAIYFAGLDPYAGYLHVDRAGRPSLVLDLMEEFRPQVVDRTIISLVSKRVLKPGEVLSDEGFSERAAKTILGALEERFEAKVSPIGWRQKPKLKTAVRLQARRIVSHILRRDRYRPFVLRD